MRRTLLIAALALLAGCGASKHTATSGHLRVTEPTDEHGKPRTEAQMEADALRIATYCMQREAERGRFKAGPPELKSREPSEKAPPCDRKRVAAALEGIQKLCKQRPRACAEAKATFGQGHEVKRHVRERAVVRERSVRIPVEMIK